MQDRFALEAVRIQLAPKPPWRSADSLPSHDHTPKESTMDEQKFTVFVTASDGWNGYCSRDGVTTLDGMIAAAVEPEKDWPVDFTPVAWMYGITTHCSHDRQISIAAGRTIKLVDGKYVAFGAEPESVRERVLKKFPDFAEAEKLREPLPGRGQRTPFDNFPGYSVTSETHADEPAPRHALQRSPDLEPSRAQVLPGFGSAHLAR